MGKNIKNYTSSVPAIRTISCIEDELVKIGVTHIEKNYVNKIPMGVIFSVQLPGITKKLSFKIPANIAAAYRVIKEIPEYKNKNDDWLQAQAQRTAWRVVLNWVEVQVAMIQLEQADAVQMFLSFVYDPKSKKTFYEKVSGGNFKMITE